METHNINHNMKKYLLFYGSFYYPQGGTYDLKESFDEIDDAIDYVLKKQIEIGTKSSTDAIDWWQIVELNIFKLVVEGGRDGEYSII